MATILRFDRFLISVLILTVCMTATAQTVPGTDMSGATTPGAAAFMPVSALPPSTAAPSVPQKALTDDAFAEIIQARLGQVDKMVGLDDDAKAKIRDTYQQAKAEVDKAKLKAAKAASYESRTIRASELVENTKADLASLRTEPDINMSDSVSVSEIEQVIATRESELNAQRSTLAKAEEKMRPARRGEIQRNAASARERLAALSAGLQSLAASDDGSPLKQAARTLAWAQRRAVEQEVLSYDRQLIECEATTDLLPIERDLAARKVALLEREIKLRQEIVNTRRQQQAERELAEASTQAAVAHPAIRRLAEENALIAEQRKTIAEKITVVSKRLDDTSRQLSGVKEQFKRSRDKVDAVGLSNAIGMLLRKQRESLPHVGYRARDLNARQIEIRDIQLELMQLGEQRSELADCEPRVRSTLAALGVATADQPGLEMLVRDTLRARKEYLDTLISDHNVYFEKLVDLDNAERQLIDEAGQCARYVDERVLWIASDSPLETSDLRYAGDGLWWLVQPDSCAEIGQALASDAWRNPVLPLLAILVFAGLLIVRPRMRVRLSEIGERAARANCCRFVPTVEALLLTAAIASAYPLLCTYIGWRLSVSLDATEACKAVGAGLLVAARVYAALEFLRLALRKNGLATAHFDWPEAPVKVVRVNVAWLRIALPPLTFLVLAMNAQSNGRWDGALGRLAFVAAIAICSLCLHRILRPWGGALQELLARNRGGWLHRLRYVWYLAAVASPLALGVLAAVGYFYTAAQLAERLTLTAYLLVGLTVARGMLLRWIRVNRRKLAMDQARRRRAAQLEAAEEESGMNAEMALPPEPERDLDTINTQTRRFVEYSLAMVSLLALWLVWVDVMPALGVLNRVDVWQVTEEITSNGKTVQRVVGAVTLGGVFIALLVLAATFLATKNIPGLLEMAVLQHLPLDAGARYAVATISRYAITLIGIVSSCGIVGLSWAKVQWLLAAISVGLGFGLQEIFANFISGLIILFERPIRVGDVITVDGVTGMVLKIRMRATTILDGDRKELIVPNKTFITGQVLNWTLSDPVNRVTISVGVAYGADTQKASELLLKAAKDHPLVLDDPAPRVTMEGFGDSSLTFVMHCFLPNMENRSQVIHELHMNIDQAFRAAGIEIPFPQTDLHVRSLDVGADVLQSALSRAEPPRDGKAKARVA